MCQPACSSGHSGTVMAFCHTAAPGKQHVHLRDTNVILTGLSPLLHVHIQDLQQIYIYALTKTSQLASELSSRSLLVHHCGKGVVVL